MTVEQTVEQSGLARVERCWRGLGPVMIGLLIVGLASGCGPTLQRAETFTPIRVRAAIYNDECRLQSYFDSAAALKSISDQNISAVEAHAWGRQSFGLRLPGQQQQLQRLVRRLYRRVPPQKLRAPLPWHANVRYQLRNGHRHMPIGAETELHVGDATIVLPYHPCLGAFFYGRRNYRLRRALRVGADRR